MIIYQRVGAAHAGAGIGIFDLAFAGRGQAPASVTTYVLASDFADRRPAVSIADRRPSAPITDRRPNVPISDRRPAAEIDQL